MRKLVVTPISNTIYWATINEKNNTMNTKTRVDVTDNAIDAVFEHLINLEGFKNDGFAGYQISKKNSEDTATICVFANDKVTFIKKENYEELLEYKAKYEALCE